MQFTVLTLFPEWVDAYCQTSIMGRAQQAGVMSVQAVNPRDFTTDPHRKVDDAPYGGGPGMVMTCQPIVDAFRSVAPLPEKTKVIMTSPLGKPFDQQMAKTFAQQEAMVFICGHYEGIDARVESLIPQVELVSLGDYVMTGGELAALCMLDATVRLLPGALGKDHSVEEESFMEGLLEYPQYTRPREYESLQVPDVLCSGHHGEVQRWQRKMSLQTTLNNRPDLLEQLTLTPEDQRLLDEVKREQQMAN